MRNLLIRCTKKFKQMKIFDFIFTYVGESIKKWPYGLPSLGGGPGRSSCRAGHLSLYLIKPPLTPPKDGNCFGKTGSLSYTLLILSIMMNFLLVTSCKDNPKKETEGETETSSIVKDTVQKKTDSSVILLFGDSLTAGLGVDPEEAFSALIQSKIDSLNLDYQVVNAGLSGETTASGVNRLNWVLDQDVKIIMIELGANDGLRGIPLDETEKNLQKMIDMVQKKDSTIKIVLAGMQIPPNMGEEYTSRFKNIFPELAKKNNIYLIPFMLENVGGVAELNQADGIHPTAEGHKIVAQNVWEVLGKVVQ